MRITYKQLRAKGACADQLALFKQHFGDGGEVTLAKCLSVASVFSWDWAARHLLSAPAQAEYERAMATAWAEYERATATAWAEYERATATALAECQRARAPAWAEYERATAPARAEYERATAPARAEYERARATAFFVATQMMETTQ